MACPPEFYLANHRQTKLPKSSTDGNKSFPTSSPKSSAAILISATSKATTTYVRSFYLSSAQKSVCLPWPTCRISASETLCYHRSPRPSLIYDFSPPFCPP